MSLSRSPRRLIARASTCLESSTSATSTGSAWPSAIESPRVAEPSRPALRGSSRGIIAETDTWEKISWSSTSEMRISVASSASVGERPNDASSLEKASSTARALVLTERGTQSMARSSSIIAPLIRATA